MEGEGFRPYLKLCCVSCPIGRLVNARNKGLRHCLLNVLSRSLATGFHDLLLYLLLPQVRPFLSSNYFNHFALLVTAIHTLLSSPTRNHLKLAGVLLECFVKEMEPLYGKKRKRMVCFSTPTYIFVSCRTNSYDHECAQPVSLGKASFTSWTIVDKFNVFI